MELRSRFVLSATLTSMFLLLLSGGAMQLVSSSSSDAATAQCIDGFDNDGDGRTDYPNDPDCINVDDNDEYSGGGAVLLSITDGRDRIAPNGSILYVITASTNNTASQTTTITAIIPPEVDVSSASNGGTINGSTIQWTNQLVTRTNPLTFTVQGTVAPRTPIGTTLVARATSNGRDTTDTTLVLTSGTTSSLPTFDVEVSDGETSILPDEDLDYIIRVENLDTVPVTIDVRATLSPYLAFVDPVDETDHNSSRILWQAQRFGPGEERTFSFSARAIERARRNEVIRVTASVGSSNDTDSTTIRSAIVPHDLDIGITDNRGQAAHGEVITYAITLDNNESGTVSDVYVSAALPIYSEFVSVNDGGFREGENVRWRSLDVTGNGSRTISFSVRVRNDAPLGTELLASAVVDGVTDYDRTTVVERSSIQSSRSTSTSTSRRTSRSGSPVVVLPPVTTTSAAPRSTTSSTRYIAQTTTPRPSQNVLLSKTADRREVLAGGTVRYRIFVNNITSNVLQNVTVSDRYNASQFTVADSGSATKVSEGTLEWSVPTLQPGDTWSASYTLKAGMLAAGTTLTNLAALNGNGLDSIALDRRLSAAKVVVVTTLPATGAPLDLAGVLLFGGLAIVPTALQRRSTR